MMHLHLKTCSATGSTKGPCPTHYHGCDQARKLLAHHRQCKSARHSSMSSSTSSSLRNGTLLSASRRSGSFDSQPAAHCLICSFVARQARTLLERGGGGAAGGSSAASGSGGGGGAGAAVFGSLGSSLSSSWHARKHPPPSKASGSGSSHTVSFVVDAVAGILSANLGAPPAKIPSPPPPAAKAGSPQPVNGILKLQPPAVLQRLLPPPPPPPPPPPSPCMEDATEQATRAGSDGDDGGGVDVVMSTGDGAARSEVASFAPSTKAVLVPDSKTPTSSPPDPTFLSEPDAASLLCSLACNVNRPLKVLPEAYSTMQHHQQQQQQQRRRDRAVSSADSLLSTATSSHPYHHRSTRHEVVTLDPSQPPQPLGLVRRRSVSLGSAPPSHHGPRALAAAASSSGSLLRVDDTIYEEGSQTSGDSIEPLDFPNF
jgi:hypothetical protein